MENNDRINTLLNNAKIQGSFQVDFPRQAKIQ